LFFAGEKKHVAMKVISSPEEHKLVSSTPKEKEKKERKKESAS